MSFIDRNNNIVLSQRNLDFLWEKQRIIAENIANNDTPGYKAKRISFQDELDKRLDKFRDNQKHDADEINRAVRQARWKIKDSPTESNRLDGNNVDVDVEQVEQLRTQLQYQFQINQINDQFTRLRTAIGRR